MSNSKSSKISRRSFLGTSLAGVAGVSVLPLLNACKPKDETIKLGFIGLGRQAMYLHGSFINIDGVTVVAGCDVYEIKRERFLQRTTDFYKEAEKDVEVKVYEKYQDLLADDQIDAVVIASPDYWHAKMAIDACKAGKDIYLEKPLTYSIKEGQELVEAVHEYDRVLAVGSQQRSDPAFQHAVKMVQEGHLGDIEKVNIYIGEDIHPKPFDEPKEPLPEGLNWDLWVGPAPRTHYNHILNPPISLDPPQDEQFWGAWRWYKEYGGGLMTDWGAHMVDIAQWGLGYQLSGPVKIIPAGYEGNEFLTYIYENGVPATFENFREGTRGVKFWGTKGWIEVARGYYEASSEAFKPVVEENEEVPYEGRAMHHVDFIESIKSRKKPAAPVEVGHHTCTACTLGNIAAELGRPLEWNPEAESFVNDDEASEYLFRSYKNGYELS